MMTWAVMALLGGIVALVGAVAWLYVRLAAPPVQPESWSTCLDEDLETKYRPMLRLLSEDDFAFLRSQPGYEPAISSRLRNERTKLYARYLKSLKRDFNRLCVAGRLIAVHSNCDRTEFLDQLARQQMRFRVRVVQAYWNLCLYRFGLSARRFAEPFSVVADLQIQIRCFIAPAPAPA